MIDMQIIWEDAIAVYFWTVLLLIVVVFAIGVLWAPVGSLICGLVAYRRRLGVKRWMGRGVVASVLFLFPWFYVLASVGGLRVSSFLKRVEYATVYLAWLFGPLSLMVVIVTGSFVAEWQGTADRFTKYPVFYTFTIVLTIANIYTWFMSLKKWGWKLRDHSPEFDVSFYRQWLAVIAWLLAFLAFLFIFFMIGLQDEYRQRTL